MWLIAGGKMNEKMGICYGDLANNIPNPEKAIKLIQSLNAKRVKIYAAQPHILNATKNTDLQISIMVPNNLIPNISTNQALADQWVSSNVLPFYPESKIRYLLVGNEILSNQPNTTWFQLVPAIRKIRHSVKKFGLKKIKVPYLLPNLDFNTNFLFYCISYIYFFFIEITDWWLCFHCPFALKLTILFFLKMNIWRNSLLTRSNS